MKRLKYLLMRVGVFAVTLPIRVRTKLFELVAELAPLLQASPLPQSMKCRISMFVLSKMKREMQRTEQRAHDLAIEITRKRWERAQAADRMQPMRIDFI